MFRKLAMEHRLQTVLDFWAVLFIIVYIFC